MSETEHGKSGQGGAHEKGHGGAEHHDKGKDSPDHHDRRKGSPDHPAPGTDDGTETPETPPAGA